MRQSQWIMALLVAALAFSAGCKKQKASDEIDFGTVKDSVYQNKYFGLSVTLPADWSTVDQETRERLMEMGGQIMAGDDKNLKAVAKASEMTSVNLFLVSEHPMGAPVQSNPNIMCVAERVREAPGVTRGEDYLFHTKRLLEASQVKLTFTEETASRSLGGRDFDVMSAQMSMADVTVRQKYCATIMKGYALVFIVSFATDEEEAALEDIMKTVTFK